MPDKIFITWTQIQEASRLIADNARDMEYKAVIGIQRGGLIPAVIISHELDIPMYSVNCSLRDHVNKPTMIHDIPHGRYLCVDDINDTGATFNWIKNDWETRHNDPGKWERIWGNNVKFAVLTENLASDFGMVSFRCDEVNKAEEDVWLVYPWENVGKYDS